MMLSELISVAAIVLIPVWVSYQVFKNAPKNRPKVASLFLTVVCGPIVYGLLALLVFAIFRTNMGAGFADPLMVLLVSILSGCIFALSIRPIADERSTEKTGSNYSA